MNRVLADKVCLVTGASRGIGAAIATELAGKGAKVIVHYAQDRARAQAVAAGLPGEGHRTVQADLVDPAIASDLVENIYADDRRLDVLVNNAGIYAPHPIREVDAEQWLQAWEQTLAVNLLAPAALCHAAAQIMRRQGGGRIINIGSRGAFRGEPESPAYGAAKAGLHAMSQSLAVALAEDGISGCCRRAWLCRDGHGEVATAGSGG